MTTAPAPARSPARAGAPARAPLPGAPVWGLDPVALHDRLWAARHVQVVRLGRGPVDAQGPSLYLLVEPTDLLAFDFGPVLRRLNWERPLLVRIRLVTPSDDDYVESVQADDDGRLLAVRRSYRARVHATHRCWLTPDPGVATAWAAATDPRAGREAVIRLAGTRLLSHKARAQVHDASDPGEVQRYAAATMFRGERPGEVLDGVYEIEPGVWLHETVHVPEGARFIAPLWIGAGARLAKDAVLCGPRVIPDHPAAVVQPRPMRWDDIELSLPPVESTRRRRSFRRALRRASKLAFDKAFAACVLLACLPVFPLIMLAIWLEDGRPFYFAHTRQTLRGRNFPCYKFRTMIKNADALKAQLARQNVCDGPQFFIKDDPRLLRVGRLLRRCQLDELPQFWNVLLGHMSVVGPRPSPDSENQFCPTWREARLSVRPGVTGLWQVRRTRAPETDFQEWIRYDLEYVQHESWRLDLWIIVQTIARVLRG
ncbi:MAG: sugar transferase [Phycisphaerae bacterium]|nr:sugar transferase [Phycisphaerae bacterium]